MANVLTPGEVKETYRPIRSQRSEGNIDLEWKVTVEGVPSSPYTDDRQWYRGFNFTIDGLTCGVSAESLREAGYDRRKIPVLMEIIRRLEKEQIKLRVVGNYKPNNQILYVGYGQTFPHILEAIDKLTREPVNQSN
ncbi:hypothetical protein J4234_06230 [Candidatus Woesearchaeota archaeon]|nr:hypothetical protein [Candidatus Woesearchaeota archaeon]